MLTVPIGVPVLSHPWEGKVRFRRPEGDVLVAFCEHTCVLSAGSFVRSDTFSPLHRTAQFLGSLSPEPHATPIIAVLPFLVQSVRTPKSDRTENVPDTELFCSGPEPELGLQGVLILFFCLLSDVCRSFTYMYICASHVCMVPREARRGPWMLWYWS